MTREGNWVFAGFYGLGEGLPSTGTLLCSLSQIGRCKTFLAPPGLHSRLYR
jgi:hypothetical protein